MSAKRKSSFSHEEWTKLPKTKDVHLELREIVNTASCIAQMKASWKNPQSQVESASDCGADMKCSDKPFRHCEISNFLANDDDVDKLKDELMDLNFSEKNNDLYKFHQSSEDLKTSQSATIKAFRDLLCGTFREWLIQVTDIQLNETVDSFCAQYIHTDTLLCHDDELEGRRIAYIYYLVNSWTAEDGGALDLFTVDDNLQPQEIVKSVLPSRNKLAFFEVTPGSYHQVSEVLSEDKIRLSISGWFHGPPIDRPPPYIETPRPTHVYGSIDDEVFFDWINPLYLDVVAQGSVQEKFENESEIELQDFLQKEKYEALLEALKSSDMCWRKSGPANKRCYNRADDRNLPAVVQTCIDLFRSDAMFLLLSNMSGLKLHELAGCSSTESDGDSEGSNQCENDRRIETETASGSSADNKDKECTARCCMEVRHWTHGCYTLVHDTDSEASQFALDTIFYLGCQDWDMECGGFTSYIAKGEDEELLTVSPQPNSLALVYRDKETLRFVKYLNTNVNKREEKGFYDISTIFYE